MTEQQNTAVLVKVMPPLASEIVRNVAVEHGVCLKPFPMRRIDVVTGDIEMTYIPCGNTLASVCPTCAESKRQIRAVQCRQGWHLEEEPRIEEARCSDRTIRRRVTLGNGVTASSVAGFCR